MNQRLPAILAEVSIPVTIKRNDNGTLTMIPSPEITQKNDEGYLISLNPEDHSSENYLYLKPNQYQEHTKIILSGKVQNRTDSWYFEDANSPIEKGRTAHVTMLHYHSLLENIIEKKMPENKRAVAELLPGVTLYHTPKLVIKKTSAES